MTFRILTLKERFEKRFKQNLPVPRIAWERQEVIKCAGYVEAHKKAQKRHPKKIVHTYVIDKLATKSEE